MAIKPSANGAVHGEKQSGINFRGEKVTHIYFKPTDKDRGCWVHENVFKELCFRRGISHV